jgi:hypothetical protein
MKKLSRDQGALDTPILSHRTNQARRGFRNLCRKSLVLNALQGLGHRSVGNSPYSPNL